MRNPLRRQPKADVKYAEQLGSQLAPKPKPELPEPSLAELHQQLLRLEGDLKDAEAYVQLVEEEQRLRWDQLREEAIRLEQEPKVAQRADAPRLRATSYPLRTPLGDWDR